MAGLPTSNEKWVRKSLRNLEKSLRKRGYGISRMTVRRLLRNLKYGLVSNRKSILKENHPDRDKQFRYIKRLRHWALDAGIPAISVDAKNKELIGNYANKGRIWAQEAEKVKLHDFPEKTTKRATPYGIYDLANNQGYVYLNTSYNTAEFAVYAISRWWLDPNRPRFKREDILLIFCDAGGSNSYRSWLWKYYLKKMLVEQLGIMVIICHYPTGASRYNPIEYRLFSQITLNWAGKPLRSLTTMLNYIQGTTTKTGLTVKAFLEERIFEKNLKVSAKERELINIERRRICPNWNYIIRPNSLPKTVQQKC